MRSHFVVGEYVRFDDDDDDENMISTIVVGDSKATFLV